MTQAWTCFTSFNRRLYDIISAEMVQSWIYHWPQDARLVVYVEDNVQLPQDPRITVIDWNKACGEMYSTVDALAQQLPAWQSDHTRRYTKKAMTFMHFLGQQPGLVCWLDADLLTVKTVPQDLLDRAHSTASVVSLFDGSRVKDDGTRPWTAESGFVLINTEHALFNDFLERYSDYYLNPRMPAHATEYWDGEILMHAARECGSWFDLRSQCQGKSSTPIHAHWLGQYFVHMKSKRKKHYSLETYRSVWQGNQTIANAVTKHSWQK